MAHNPNEPRLRGRYQAASYPRVVSVGMAAPGVLELTVHTGYVRRHGQEPYVKEPDDRIERSLTGTLVERHGKFYAALVGKDEKLMWRYEDVHAAEFDPEAWQQPGALTITSTDDPHYGTAQHPLAVHRKTRPVEVVRVGPWNYDAPLEHVFFVVLPAPLREGAHYVIEVPKLEQQAIELHYEPRTMLSESVHASQVGFRPDDPVKRATVSCFMGTGGTLAFEGELGFEVVDEQTGASVAEGKLCSLEAPVEAGKNLLFGAPLVADFSSVTRPGNYRVYVRGMGCSQPFPIGHTAWRTAFATAAKGFYHHRRSIELGPPYTTFRRPRNLDPRIGTQIVKSTTGIMDTGNGLSRTDKGNFGYLVAGRTDERAEPECWGGLMDAGDWDSRVQHLVVSRDLLELAEMGPDYFAKLSLAIPESGNGLPDVVNEALYNLDHYRRMQTPDGGIRGGIESEEHPRLGEASHQESLAVLVYSPDIWASYLYAATACKAYRVLAELGSSLAPDYLESARRAMRFAETHFPDREEYAPDVYEARAFAAAAMYQVTGEAEFHELFLATSTCRAELPPVEKMGRRQLEAGYLYLRTEFVRDPEVVARCRRALLAHADALVERARYPHVWPEHLLGAMWGGMVNRPRRSLIRAHYLTGDQKYLEAALALTSLAVGDNPQNLCYTTSLGSRWPKSPLHIDSFVTGQPAPPGITLAGPVDSTGFWAEGFVEHVEPHVYPPITEWPPLETFWNMLWYVLIAEYTVQHPMAETAFVYGYFASRPCAWPCR